MFTISLVSESKKLLIGKIVAPQGLKGEARVQTYTSRPDDLLKLKIESSEFKISFVRAIGKNLAICKIDGINDRNAVEKLKGLELFVTRADLPGLKKDEHYIADLIGMTVITRQLRSPVHVVDVHNFGAGDILELDNGEMISFNGAIVDSEKKEIKYE